VLVFTTTKEECDNLVKNLKLDGLKSISVHGGKTQSARAKAIKAFRKKEIRILVATDIASRGIDISGLPYVINYSLPSVSEDYIHRVGRTGRAGEYGHAISLVDEYDFTYLKEIEKLIKIKIDKEIIKGFELDPNIKPISLSSQNKETQKSKPKKKTFVPPIKKKHRRTTKRG
jgi:ATP-dependent RNA helicase RhlE